MSRAGSVGRDEYLKLRRQLDLAADTYYNSDRLMMDDADYDRLARQVIAVEDTHPDWVEDGRADEVAAGTADGGTIPHAQPLLSLDNVFDGSELAEFLTRAPEATWVVEAKLDGLAAAATYRRGRLVTFATRGDGITGEDLTGHHADLVGLPDTLNEPVDLTVRGELYMGDTQFTRANSLREDAGDPLLANPRNGVAGAMRARHGRYRLPASFAAYAWPSHDELTHQEAVATLTRLGVACAATLTGAETVEAAQVAGEIDRIQQQRAQLGFPVDGAVVKASDQAVRRTLGETSRAPRWATAYKFPADTALTRLTGISITVGRTGVLTPVATFAPVNVGGATIKNATCSNPSEVIRKDLRVGDAIWIRRAGDVIPEIVAVNLDKRPDGTTAWQPPSSCPRCAGTIDRSSRRWRCTNRICGGSEAIEYFASRDAMDIDGLGPGVVNILVDADLVHTPADLYVLTVEQLTSLDRFGDRKARQLVTAIDRSRTAPLHRVICALGARGTGRTISRRLGRTFASLTSLQQASAESLAAVEGIGTVKAALIRQELDDLAPLIYALVGHGIDPDRDTGPDDEGLGPLAGKKVVVTGRIPGLTRQQATEAVERLGGAAAASVSRGVDLVVIGDGAGSKAQTAADLSIAVMPAEEFAKLAAAAV